MGGRSSLLVAVLSMVLLDQRLQLLACVEGHDAARRDRNLFARLGIAAGALRLVAELKVAEPGELDALAVLESQADLLEEGLHHVLGFALVEADLLEQHVRQLGFCKCHFRSLTVSTPARGPRPFRASSRLNK